MQSRTDVPRAGLTETERDIVQPHEAGCLVVDIGEDLWYGRKHHCERVSLGA